MSTQTSQRGASSASSRTASHSQAPARPAERPHPAPSGFDLSLQESSHRADDAGRQVPEEWSVPLDAARVQAVLDELFDSALRQADDFGPAYVGLWTSLRRATEGGKRFRPALLTGVFRELGGTDTEVVCTVAAAVELLHTAFVVHDDVIDHDTVRRGHLNVSGTFAAQAAAVGASAERASTLGVAAGILAGDLALTSAQRLVALSMAPAEIKADLLAIVEHAIFVTAAGELSDVSFTAVDAQVPLDEVVRMAAHKTAVYSFELPLQAGALLAGADRRTVDGLARVGRDVGVAFQLLDDLDGVFGDEATIGKSVLTDLREGKVTPLVAHARTTGRWAEVSDCFGDPGLTEADAARVRGVLDECGSRAFVEGQAQAYLASARALAEESGLPVRLVDWVQTMAGVVLGKAA